MSELDATEARIAMLENELLQQQATADEIIEILNGISSIATEFDLDSMKREISDAVSVWKEAEKEQKLKKKIEEYREFERQAALIVDSNPLEVDNFFDILRKVKESQIFFSGLLTHASDNFSYQKIQSFKNSKSNLIRIFNRGICSCVECLANILIKEPVIHSSNLTFDSYVANFVLSHVESFPMAEHRGDYSCSASKEKRPSSPQPASSPPRSSSPRSSSSLPSSPRPSHPFVPSSMLYNIQWLCRGLCEWEKESVAALFGSIRSNLLISWLSSIPISILDRCVCSRKLDKSQSVAGDQQTSATISTQATNPEKTVPTTSDHGASLTIKAGSLQDEKRKEKVQLGDASPSSRMRSLSPLSGPQSGKNTAIISDILQHKHMPHSPRTRHFSPSGHIRRPGVEGSFLHGQSMHRHSRYTIHSTLDHVLQSLSLSLKEWKCVDIYKRGKVVMDNSGHSKGNVRISSAESKSSGSDVDKIPSSAKIAFKLNNTDGDLSTSLKDQLASAELVLKALQQEVRKNNNHNGCISIPIFSVPARDCVVGDTFEMAIVPKSRSSLTVTSGVNPRYSDKIRVTRDTVKPVTVKATHVYTGSLFLDYIYYLFNQEALLWRTVFGVPISCDPIYSSFTSLCQEIIPIVFSTISRISSHIHSKSRSHLTHSLQVLHRASNVEGLIKKLLAKEYSLARTMLEVPLVTEKERQEMKLGIFLKTDRFKKQDISGREEETAATKAEEEEGDEGEKNPPDQGSSQSLSNVPPLPGGLLSVSSVLSTFIPPHGPFTSHHLVVSFSQFIQKTLKLNVQEYVRDFGLKCVLSFQKGDKESVKGKDEISTLKEGKPDKDKGGVSVTDGSVKQPRGLFKRKRIRSMSSSKYSIPTDGTVMEFSLESAKLVQALVVFEPEFRSLGLTEYIFNPGKYFPFTSAAIVATEPIIQTIVQKALSAKKMVEDSAESTLTSQQQRHTRSSSTSSSSTLTSRSSIGGPSSSRSRRGSVLGGSCIAVRSSLPIFVTQWVEYFLYFLFSMVHSLSNTSRSFTLIVNNAQFVRQQLRSPPLNKVTQPEAILMIRCCMEEYVIPKLLDSLWKRCIRVLDEASLRSTAIKAGLTTEDQEDSFESLSRDYMPLTTPPMMIHISEQTTSTTGSRRLSLADTRSDISGGHDSHSVADSLEEHSDDMSEFSAISQTSTSRFSMIGMPIREREGEEQPQVITKSLNSKEMAFKKVIKAALRGFRREFSSARAKINELSFPDSDIRGQLCRKSVQMVASRYRKFIEHCNLCDLGRRLREKYIMISETNLLDEMEKIWD
ncbi:Exocyst complex component Exo70 like protein [Aduncisulcus paluster]|uniref:Exocyst complex component Exo70 like protein n=1 Tax=Aduncisulcus paluster TaxID=2918883 RepID=A0ABQ5JZS8_9EUKA|nr:Exocyst complex component Exo70 like protein [Aduncisulcus paluster]